METGKVPENVLKRSVLGRMKVKSGERQSGAGIGNDCAIFPFSGEFPGPFSACFAIFCPHPTPISWSTEHGPVSGYPFSSLNPLKWGRLVCC